jgi:hypothetical protein
MDSQEIEKAVFASPFSSVILSVSEESGLSLRAGSGEAISLQARDKLRNLAVRICLKNQDCRVAEFTLSKAEGLPAMTAGGAFY